MRRAQLGRPAAQACGGLGGRSALLSGADRLPLPAAHWVGPVGVFTANAGRLLRSALTVCTVFWQALDGGRRGTILPMSTPVDARSNGHSAKTYGNPLGIECEACKRRALV